MPAPWKVLRSHREHDYAILTIREEFVSHPRDGSEHPRVVITSPDWVQLVPLTDAGEVVMVRQWRNAVRGATLEMPGGLVDPNEPAIAGAARELEEETGFRAKEVLALGSVHPNPALQTNRAHVFVGLGCAQVHGGEPDAGEDLEVVRVPIDALFGKVQSGEISHALTVAALYLFERWRAARGP